ncbi:hypothetical protein NDU88_005224 [Pleurodeles waltl]|uniref:Uncharacterized protein n=1 Tax=Pleurodeles waltl TaxID=8319 RepID=A0AAV7UHI4_PLEWA|nr:hypothetical protein NDU88_005224 [Pleurodeles waltl]
MANMADITKARAIPAASARRRLHKGWLQVIFQETARFFDSPDKMWKWLELRDCGETPGGGGSKRQNWWTRPGGNIHRRVTGSGNPNLSPLDTQKVTVAEDGTMRLTTVPSQLEVEEGSALMPEDDHGMRGPA